MRSQHRVWEAIAQSFDQSRTKRWPHVERFLATLPPRSSVLDLMGGNGRHIASILAAGHEPAWLDWSRPAARIVAARYPASRVVVGDATALPLRDAAFDGVILVAGLHSLPTAQARADCLQELRRILRPGGLAQVTVWSRDAPRFRAQGEPGEPMDVVLPWRSHGHDEARQYHLYTRPALRRDLEAAGLHVLEESQAAIVAAEPDNLVAVVQRHA